MGAICLLEDGMGWEPWSVVSLPFTPTGHTAGRRHWRRPMGKQVLQHEDGRLAMRCRKCGGSWSVVRPLSMGPSRWTS